LNILYTKPKYFKKKQFINNFETFFNYIITIYLSKQTLKYSPIIKKHKRNEDQKKNYKNYVFLTEYNKHNNTTVVYNEYSESEVI